MGVVGVVAATVSEIPIGSRPGWTLNTPTPWRLVSRARFSVSLTTAALETEYADTSGQRWTPAWLVRLMIRPRLAATMSGRTSWEHSTMPRRLTSIVVHHAAGSTSHSGPIGPMIPALLTSRSIGPSRRRSSATAAAISAASVTSAAAAAAVPPAASIEPDGVGQLVLGAGDQGDRRPGIGEGPGDELPDAPPGAGDERDRALQPGGVEPGRRSGGGTGVDGDRARRGGDGHGAIPSGRGPARKLAAATDPERSEPRRPEHRLLIADRRSAR